MQLSSVNYQFQISEIEAETGTEDVQEAETESVQDREDVGPDLAIEDEDHGLRTGKGGK